MNKLRLIKWGSNAIQIMGNEMSILFSYETPVACHISGEGYKRTAAHHSSTTTRHINDWLRREGSALNVKTEPQEYFDKLL